MTHINQGALQIPLNNILCIFIPEFFVWDGKLYNYVVLHPKKTHKQTARMYKEFCLEARVGGEINRSYVTALFLPLLALNAN